MTTSNVLAEPTRRGVSDLRRHRGEARQNLLLHIVGMSLAVCGAGIVVSSLVEAMDGGPDTIAMMVTGAVIGVIGLVCWFLTDVPERIALLDVFATVTSAWVIMAIAGAVPYLVTGTLDTLDAALFESVSGFTTTGATVLRPIEDASAGILFWRSITQWLGGMGVIVLVVAVLPTVGSGGMDLLEAEAPGPTGERLTPRVTQTAQRLWAVYIGFTILLAIAYLAAGMSLYDAVGHSFTTVSTGGFSSHTESMAYFQSAVIEWIAVAAMFIAGTSFTLLYRLVRGSTGPLLRSVEFRLYCLIVAGATLAVFFVSDGVERNLDGLRQSAFVVLAIVSTTGYGLADFGQWSQAAQALILILMPLGAMAGSTAGGVKMIRVLAVASYAHRETLKQLHPRIVRPVRIGDVVLDDRIANKVLAFFVLALGIFGGTALAISLTGEDLITAFSAAATLFGNVGPGLGEVGPSSDFLNLGRVARMIGMGAMLLGRLEIYPILLALVALPYGGPRRWFGRFISPMR